MVFQKEKGPRRSPLTMNHELTHFMAPTVASAVQTTTPQPVRQNPFSQSPSSERSVKGHQSIPRMTNPKRANEVGDKLQRAKERREQPVLGHNEAILHTASGMIGTRTAFPFKSRLPTKAFLGTRKPLPNQKPLLSAPVGRVITKSPLIQSRSLMDASERPLRRSPLGNPDYEEDWPVLYPKPAATPVEKGGDLNKRSPHGPGSVERRIYGKGFNDDLSTHWPYSTRPAPTSIPLHHLSKAAIRDHRAKVSAMRVSTSAPSVTTETPVQGNTSTLFGSSPLSSIDEEPSFRRIFSNVDALGCLEGLHSIEAGETEGCESTPFHLTEASERFPIDTDSEEVDDYNVERGAVRTRRRPLQSDPAAQFAKAYSDELVDLAEVPSQISGLMRSVLGLGHRRGKELPMAEDLGAAEGISADANEVLLGRLESDTDDSEEVPKLDKGKGVASRADWGDDAFASRADSSDDPFVERGVAFEKGIHRTETVNFRELADGEAGPSSREVKEEPSTSQQQSATIPSANEQFDENSDATPTSATPPTNETLKSSSRHISFASQSPSKTKTNVDKRGVTSRRPSVYSRGNGGSSSSSPRLTRRVTPPRASVSPRYVGRSTGHPPRFSSRIPPAEGLIDSNFSAVGDEQAQRIYGDQSQQTSDDELQQTSQDQSQQPSQNLSQPTSRVPAQQTSNISNGASRTRNNINTAPEVGTHNKRVPGTRSSNLPVSSARNGTQASKSKTRQALSNIRGLFHKQKGESSGSSQSTQNGKHVAVASTSGTKISSNGASQSGRKGINVAVGSTSGTNISSNGSSQSGRNGKNAALPSTSGTSIPSARGPAQPSRPAPDAPQLSRSANGPSQGSHSATGPTQASASRARSPTSDNTPAATTPESQTHYAEINDIYTAAMRADEVLNSPTRPAPVPDQAVTSRAGRLADRLIDQARTASPGPERLRLVEMATMMVVAVTQENNARIAWERAQLAAAEAQVAYYTTNQSLVEAGELVDRWEADLERRFDSEV